MTSKAMMATTMRTQVRLTLLFVVIVTLVLGISGSYTQYTLSRDLEAGSARLRTGVLTRLQTSLPSALWDLDKSKVDSIVAAEMLPPELIAIRVYDASVGLFAGEMRDAAGALQPLLSDLAIAGMPVEAPLVFRDAGGDGSGARPVIVGKVIVNFSGEQINAALRSEVRRKVMEVLLLDIILVAALSLSLRIIFRPLRQLRDGLVDLATRGSDDVEELPETRRDELGDVIRGFNAVQRKLKSIIERIREAEDAARRSQHETAQAMDELRRAQESLLQAERLASLGSLVAGVAHEINTPVGIALTSASVLKEATDDISAAVAGGAIKKTDIMRYLETASESARLIMNNAYRAAHLIHSFKQIAVDQVSEARRLFELRDYIGEVVASLQPTLKKTRIAITIDCPPEIMFDSYPGALAQVLTNLVLNCVEHAFDADTAGTIHIGVRCDQDWIDMQVRDNGRGIAPDLIDRVFDPFVTTRRGQGGTGLGLNIVFNLIAKQFGGTITVHSTVGQGATFLLRLPRVTPLPPGMDGQADEGG
ncbi:MULTISPECIES: sensor histidine kinase [unclassified Janthinobacterium]|uniref:sensor histidine kinase n=1 Tax=unclassified Janthinobacterium TaxID=2610881 RepID=UPI001856C18E|nr:MULTISPECIES: HAMP domain-containing sensor histidine kinase [unclassified Janthinobacterium]MBB5607635.1 signal transduction histidine kinase [Janthinobacterium sp. S3T4]MBB5612657.1 signal transduction histidine kinase [Janthinobacterium sp. S3M3]